MAFHHLPAVPSHISTNKHPRSQIWRVSASHRLDSLHDKTAHNKHHHKARSSLCLGLVKRLVSQVQQSESVKERVRRRHISRKRKTADTASSRRGSGLNKHLPIRHKQGHRCTYISL